jgi:Protein of unknown function (DUF3892)
VVSDLTSAVLCALPAEPVIEIVAIRLSGGRGHEHVTNVLWRGATVTAFTSTSVGQSTVQGIVDWLCSRASNKAVVDGGVDYLQVVVVREPDRPPHIRAQQDGECTDRLLALPTF